MLLGGLRKPSNGKLDITSRQATAAVAKLETRCSKNAPCSWLLRMLTICKREPPEDIYLSSVPPKTEARCQGPASGHRLAVANGVGLSPSDFPHMLIVYGSRAVWAHSSCDVLRCRCCWGKPGFPRAEHEMHAGYSHLGVRSTFSQV